MAGPRFEEDDAATPLSPEERQGLIPSYITLRRELNEAELQGVLAADVWAFARRRPVLDERFLRNLHKRMFGGVWRWAGAYRRTERNIGINAYRISTEVVQLIEDVRFWIENQTYPLDEIATRFHHRLVWIHAFPNGNGRHARLAADLLLARMHRPRFTWGSKKLTDNLIDSAMTRQKYIAALRSADQHDISALLAFVRS